MVAGLLALSLLVSQVPVVPLPCADGENTVSCKCKQQSASACAALAAGDEETLKAILRAAAMVEGAKKAKQERANATDVVDTGGCGSGQDPNDDDAKQKCTGQLHHIISMTVWRALELHQVLRGHYTYRDPRFVTRAKDLQAHCGCQDWHRALDEEIRGWLRDNAKATAEQFEAYLRELYARPALQARFPNGF